MLHIPGIYTTLRYIPVYTTLRYIPVYTTLLYVPVYTTLLYVPVYTPGYTTVWHTLGTLQHLRLRAAEHSPGLKKGE